MWSLLGPNVAVMHQTPELVARWKPPVCVVMDHGTPWMACAEQTPETVFIGRQYRAQEPDFNDPDVDPVAAAHEYTMGLLPLARGDGAAMEFWQGPNEPAIGSEAAMARYSRFEAERVRLLALEGFKAAVGTFAVGNPGNVAWWGYFLPALVTAQAAGGILALHQYDWPLMLNRDPRCDTEWLGLRHRKVYDGELSHDRWPGLLHLHVMIPLVITETGLDRLIIGKRGGWRNLGLTADEYLEQLRAYDEELRRDPYALGAAIFCCGQHGDWWGYDIYGKLAETLACVAKPEYRSWLLDPTGEVVPMVDDLRLRRKQYPKRSTDEIERIIIHHSAVHPKEQGGAYMMQHIRAIARGHQRRGWPGIAYHYCIGPRGDIYQVNALNRVAYHAGRFNQSSVGICLLGALHKYDPPAAQLLALKRLCNLLGYRVVGHKDVARTQCPGRWWDTYNWS